MVSRIKIKPKTEDNTTTRGYDNLEHIANKHELIKFTTQVQSEINDKITSDMVLCRLGAQDKIGVTEMTVNAYLATRQIHQMRFKKVWNWDDKDKKWKLEPLSFKKQRYIEEVEQKVFKTYMTKVMMTSILNRNVDGNYLIDVLSERRKEEGEEHWIVTGKLFAQLLQYIFAF